MFCTTVKKLVKKHKFGEINKLLTLVLFQNGEKLVCKSIFMDSNTTFVKKVFSHIPQFFKNTH